MKNDKERRGEAIEENERKEGIETVTSDFGLLLIE